MADRDEERSHWNAYAERWSLVGPPLRPSAADTLYVKATVERLLERHERAQRALLLGVTPELARINWQPPFQLLAVDRSPGMVEGVWPGDTELRRACVGDWLAVELPSADFSLALGDGVFSLLEYPSQYRALGAKLASALGPAGLFSVRLFCRAEPHESVDEVVTAAFAGQIGNFNVFKWRLAMALQGPATNGVMLADIWRAFEACVPSIAELAQQTGYPKDVVATIESYRDVRDRFSFSSEAEVEAALAPWFELVARWQPDYELGERCPHLTFRRRA